MAGECWIAVEVPGTRMESVSKLRGGWRGDWLLTTDSIELGTRGNTPSLCIAQGTGSEEACSKKRGASVCSPALEMSCTLDETGGSSWRGANASIRMCNGSPQCDGGEHKGTWWSKQIKGLQFWKGGKYGKHLAAGALSAALSKTVVAPLERVRMDVILGNSNVGPVGTAIGVWRKEGLIGFWRGNGLNLMRNAPFKVGQDPGNHACTPPP